MHRIAIPQDIVERIVRRRGRLHAYETIPGAHCALLVIDMQNAYLAPGAPAEIPIAREIVPNINRLARSLRRAEGRVVWVQNALGPETEGEWSAYFELRSKELGSAMRDSMIPGSVGYALWPGLLTDPQDWFITKSRYSPLSAPGGDALQAKFHAAGIEWIVIAGTATNVCCESTARDAMMRNFRAIMVADATATRSDGEHMSTLINMIQSFGDVFTVAELETMFT